MKNNRAAGLMPALGLVVFLVLGVAADAFSHGKKVSPAMKKQHQSMEAIGRQWQAFQKAWQGEAGKEADKALARILERTRSLEEFTLHRHADKRPQFVEQSRSFREKIVSLRNALQAGDGEQVRALEKEVGDDCVSCHALFK